MKIALPTRVRADRIAEYEQAHTAVPPALTAAIAAAGVTSWTIWRSGTDLFHVIDCADYPALLASLAPDPLNIAWQARMAGLPDTPHDLPARRRQRRAPGCLAAVSADVAGIVDAHHHVWDLSSRDQPWISGPGMAAIRRRFSLDDLRPAAKAAGVGATVVVRTVTVPGETPELLALRG